MTRTTGFALAASLAMAAACGGNATEGDPTGGSGAMQVTVETDRTGYAAGQAIEMTLTVRNVSGAAVTLDFTSSQRYDFQILEPSGESAWTWSAARSFAQMLGSETVPAGEALAWTETAEVDLEPGDYTVVGTVTNRAGGLSDRTEITIR